MVNKSQEECSKIKLSLDKPVNEKREIRRLSNKDPPTKYSESNQLLSKLTFPEYSKTKKENELFVSQEGLLKLVEYIVSIRLCEPVSLNQDILFLALQIEARKTLTRFCLVFNRM